MWIGGAVGVVAVAAIIVGAIATRHNGGSPKHEQPAAIVTIDAAPPPAAIVQPARIDVRSDPPGAQVIVDGATWREPTPTIVEVTPNAKHLVEVTLAGRRPYRDPAVVIAAGETLRLPVTLVPAGVTLVVKSTPPGADAELDGRSIGKTPITIDVDPDGQSHTVKIRKFGYVDSVSQVKLDPGGAPSIDATLDVRYGYVGLYVEPWADVYLNGQKVGQAPDDHLKLPVGHQRLHLVNPEAKKQMDVYVDVPATGVGKARFTMP
jgi:hypothetical protein